MTEMTRWVEADLPPRVRRMLDAAQREEPSPEILTRSLAAVAGAGVVTTLAAHAAAGTATGGAVAGATGTAAAGAATQAGAATTIGLLKWGLVGLMGGIVAVGAVDGAQRVLDSPPAPATATAIPVLERSEPVAMPSAVPPLPAPAPVASDAPRAVVGFPEVGPAGSHAPSQLAIEIRMVEQARAALREGRLDAAVAAAGAYQKRFPAGQFAPELDYIRMEALDRQGNHAAAAEAARQVVTRHPSGPQLLRAQQILDREPSDPLKLPRGLSR